MADAPELREGNPPNGGDPGGESHWTHLAQQYWSKPSKFKKVKPDIIKQEIWDVLERESFYFRSLSLLENLQLLEKYVGLYLR